MPWDRVHDEAEVLEHVLSEELEELIAAKLGHPTRDPHGDPIPSVDLVSRSSRPRASATLEPGAQRRVRADLRRRSRDAPLPRRARDRARRRVRGGRPPAVRRPAVRPLRRRRAGARRRARARDERGGTAREHAGSRGPDDLRRRPDRAAARADPRRAAVPRPGVRGRDRLRRPGQLRHQHRRRLEVRLPAAVGDPRREPDGDADPAPVGEGRHRDRPQPPRAVPRAVPAAGLVRPVGPGGADRDGDRPRGVRRRGDRAQPAVRHAAAARRPGDRSRGVRAARPADARLPAVRDRDRRDARRDPARLPGRHADGPSRRRRDRRRLHPGLPGHRLAAAGHRHPRRDRDAARDLPAFGAHPAPGLDAGRRPSAAGCCASSGST